MVYDLLLTLNKFWFLYPAPAMPLLFTAFPLLTCDKPRKPICLNLHDFLFQSSSGNPVHLCVCSHLNSKHPDCPPHAPARPSEPSLCLRWDLFHCSSPPPPRSLYLAFSALSNVSKDTMMFSGSQLLGAKRAIFFPILLTLSCYFVTLNGVWMKHRNHVKVRKALLWRLRKQTKEKHMAALSLISG